MTHCPRTTASPPAKVAWHFDSPASANAPGETPGMPTGNKRGICVYWYGKGSAQYTFLF